MAPESRKGRPHSGPTTSRTRDHGTAAPSDWKERCAERATPFDAGIACAAGTTSYPWYAPNAPELTLEWWTSPALAYWQGLRDGAALERARLEPVDDQVHRGAVRRAVRIVERAESRERADLGEAAA